MCNQNYLINSQKKMTFLHYQSSSWQSQRPWRLIFSSVELPFLITSQRSQAQTVMLMCVNCALSETRCGPMFLLSERTLLHRCLHYQCPEFTEMEKSNSIKASMRKEEHASLNDPDSVSCSFGLASVQSMTWTLKTIWCQRLKPCSLTSKVFLFYFIFC